jgi:hypothetical protein
VELLHLGFVETHQIVNNTRLCGFWNRKEILACPIPRILGLNGVFDKPKAPLRRGVGAGPARRSSACPQSAVLPRS